MIRNKTRITALLAAVPYLLLSASENVTFTTIVERDGSGLRQFTASCLDDREEEVTKRIREASAKYDVERRQVKPGQTVIIRNWRPAGLDNLPQEEGVSLQIADIAQQPLSFFTYYHWSEPVRIEAQTATPMEKEGRSKAVLRYVLQMPGSILPATVSTGGQIADGRVVWELPGDQEETLLEASSRQVRWGYLLITLYVLGFIAFQVVSFTQRVIKNRPRKI